MNLVTMLETSLIHTDNSKSGEGTMKNHISWTVNKNYTTKQCAQLSMYKRTATHTSTQIIELQPMINPTNLSNEENLATGISDHTENCNWGMWELNTNTLVAFKLKYGIWLEKQRHAKDIVGGSNAFLVWCWCWGEGLGMLRGMHHWHW